VCRQPLILSWSEVRRQEARIGMALRVEQKKRRHFRTSGRQSSKIARAYKERFCSESGQALN
jgi:hypothetical protein